MARHFGIRLEYMYQCLPRVVSIIEYRSRDRITRRSNDMAQSGVVTYHRISWEYLFEPLLQIG